MALLAGVPGCLWIPADDTSQPASSTWSDDFEDGEIDEFAWSYSGVTWGSPSEWEVSETGGDLVLRSWTGQSGMTYGSVGWAILTRELNVGTDTHIVLDLDWTGSGCGIGPLILEVSDGFWPSQLSQGGTYDANATTETDGRHFLVVTSAWEAPFSGSLCISVSQDGAASLHVDDTCTSDPEVTTTLGDIDRWYLDFVVATAVAGGGEPMETVLQLHSITVHSS